jgi:transposase-like protein
MDFSSSDITTMVFGRVSHQDLGEFSLDGRMLNVLMELDGQKNVAAVAKKTGLSHKEIRDVLSRLVEHNLAEPIEEAMTVADQEFLDFLTRQLGQAIGPIAEVLIEDAATELGYSLDKFPGHRVAELVDLLAKEIQKEDKRNEFKQNMLKMIKEKGY